MTTGQPRNYLLTGKKMRDKNQGSSNKEHTEHKHLGNVLKCVCKYHFIPYITIFFYDGSNQKKNVSMPSYL